MDEEIVEETRSRSPVKRILVIDDDGRVRQALRALIEACEGLSYAGEASSSITGRDAAAALTPDVIILDLLLPSAEEGFDLLSFLVSRGFVVVALSVREALQAAALQAGAAGFVGKPAGGGALLDLLLELPG